MKRLAPALVALSLPLLLVACEPVVEPPPGSRPCTDITGGGGSFDGTDMLFSVFLEDNPCPDIRYRFVVEEGERGPRLGEATYQGNARVERADFVVAVYDDDDDTVCIFAETIAADGTLLDRAPDSGCGLFTIGQGAPGNRGFR